MANTTPKTMTVTVMVRLTEAQAEDLDERRGQTTRSAYFRSLLSKPDHPVPATDPHQPPTVTRPSDPHHLHRYVRGDILRYDKGQPIYQRTCVCGDTKE